MAAQVPSVLLHRLQEENGRLQDEKRLLQEENRRLKASLEAEKEAAIADRNDLCTALDSALLQSGALRRELDEKFAQLVEARIARDKAVVQMESATAASKSLQERLGRQKRAVEVVSDQALRMLERARKLADGEDAGKEEEAKEKWIRILVAPLVEEMGKIESSFNKKRRLD